MDLKLNLSQPRDLFSVEPRPWWMHVGLNIQKRVLLLGSVELDSIISISQLAEIVHLYGFDNENLENLSEIGNVHFVEEFDKIYDAVIVSNINNQVSLATIKKIYENHLGEYGIILVNESNEYCLERHHHGLLKLVANMFVNIRKNEILSSCPKSTIKQFCSFSKNGSVRHSFSPSLYQTNKNTFLIKEKIKSAIFNSFSHRIFHNSNLWLISNNNELNDLDCHIRKSFEVSNNVDFPSGMQCSWVFYKFGKLILIYKDVLKQHENIVVVLALSEFSIEQRDNELATTEKIASIPFLSKYIASKINKQKLDGFSFYIMNQTSGITVDMPNENLSLMTNNACKVILELAENTINDQVDRTALTEKIKEYAANIIYRIPVCKSEVNSIVSYLSEHLSESKFPLVCLHGDSKLENFVLSPQYDVVGIIDWELGEFDSFPLLDLVYLLIYNLQMTSDRLFCDIYSEIWEGKSSNIENRMINDYCDKFSISINERKLLLMVYFLHNYGQRILITDKATEAYNSFSIVLKLLAEYVTEQDADYA